MPTMITRTAALNADGYRNATITVRAGFDLAFARQTNQRPHLSVTCDIHERGRDVGGGAAHDLIVATWPDLADLVRFHLHDNDGTPMHYVADGDYWWQGATGRRQMYAGPPAETPETCARYLWNHAVYPHLPGDVEGYDPERRPDSDPVTVPAGVLPAYWSERLPKLDAGMRAACAALGIDVPTEDYSARRAGGAS